MDKKNYLSIRFLQINYVWIAKPITGYIVYVTLSFRFIGANLTGATLSRNFLFYSS